MIHENLLSNINSNNFMNSRTLATPYAALRAVVELHTFGITNKGRSLNKRCNECGFVYPCPTIEAIEKELQ